MGIPSMGLWDEAAASHLELQVRPDSWNAQVKKGWKSMGTINIYGKWWIPIYKWKIYPKFWCWFMIFSIQWLSLGGYTPFLVRPKMVDFPRQDSGFDQPTLGAFLRISPTANGDQSEKMPMKTPPEPWWRNTNQHPMMPWSSGPWF